MNKNKNLTYFFMVFYFLYSFKTILLSSAIEDTSIDILKNLFNIITLIMAGISFLYIPLSRKVILSITLLLLVTNYVFYSSLAFYSYFVLLSMIFISEKISHYEVVKLIFFLNIILILTIMPFVFFSNTFYVFDERFGYRLTLGFGNSNVMTQFFIMFFCIVNYFFALKKTNISMRNIISLLVFIPILILIYLSGSRTGLMMLTLCFLGFIWAINTKENVYNKKVYVLYFIGVLSIIAIQFYLVNNFNANGLLITINQLLAGRVFYSNRLVNEVGHVPLFHGLNIDSYMPIDFYFIQTFYTLGAIATFVFLYIIISKMKKSNLTKYSVVVIFTCLIATATESYFMIPLYNFSLFILFSKLDRREV